MAAAAGMIAPKKKSCLAHPQNSMHGYWHLLIFNILQVKVIEPLGMTMVSISSLAAGSFAKLG